MPLSQWTSRLSLKWFLYYSTWKAHTWEQKTLLPSVAFSGLPELSPWEQIHISRWAKAPLQDWASLEPLRLGRTLISRKEMVQDALKKFLLQEMRLLQEECMCHLPVTELPSKPSSDSQLLELQRENQSQTKPEWLAGEHRLSAAKSRHQLQENMSQYIIML